MYDQGIGVYLLDDRRTPVGDLVSAVYLLDDRGGPGGELGAGVSLRAAMSAPAIAMAGAAL
jgi:hypothetical protein